MGCWCPPSPALMIGIDEREAATYAAPSFGCRMAQISAKQQITRVVSATLSPFDAEDEAASEKPITFPPRFSMAVSKLSLVRVLGS